MTLKEAIKHAEAKSKYTSTLRCAKEHQQLAKWLRELQAARKELNHLRQTSLAGIMHMAGASWHKRQRPVIMKKHLKDVWLGTVFGGTPMEGDL